MGRAIHAFSADLRLMPHGEYSQHICIFIIGTSSVIVLVLKRCGNNTFLPTEPVAVDNAEVGFIISFVRKIYLGIGLILSVAVLDDLWALTVVFTGSAWLGRVYYIKWWAGTVIFKAIELCWTLIGPAMLWPLYRNLVINLSQGQGEQETREGFIRTYKELENEGTTSQVGWRNDFWGLYLGIHTVFYAWAFWVLLKDLRGEPRTWWGGSVRRRPHSDDDDLERKY